MGPFNEWSDHTPLSFSIRCNNYVPLNNSYTETRYKWDNSFTQQFRSGIIAQLHVFNTLVNNIDCSQQSVNNIVNSFTDVLRDIADPLFAKQCRFRIFLTMRTILALNTQTGLIQCVPRPDQYI